MFYNNKIISNHLDLKKSSGHNILDKTAYNVDVE